MALIVTVSTLIVVFLCETICYLNLRLLFTIFYLKKIAFKPDLTLVYLILAGDAGYSFCGGFNKKRTIKDWHKSANLSPRRSPEKASFLDI